MLSNVLGNPFLFSHRLIRHNVIDVGIFLLGTLHPPTGELRFSYQSRDCGRVLPCLGGTLLDPSAVWAVIDEGGRADLDSAAAQHVFAAMPSATSDPRRLGGNEH